MVRQILHIYTDNGLGNSNPTFHDIEISDYSYKGNRMGMPDFTATLMWKTPLDNEWTGREYVVLNGERFYIRHTPSGKKSNNDERYSHEIVFTSEYAEILGGTYFEDTVPTTNVGIDVLTKDKPCSNSSKITFYGTIAEFCDRLNCSLLKAGIGDSALNIKTSLTTNDEVIGDGFCVMLDPYGDYDKEKTYEFSFEKKKHWEAITEGYNITEIPFERRGRKIIFGAEVKVVEHVFEYGSDNALLSVYHKNANAQVVNRITMQGSSENIPYYYPNETEYGHISIATKTGNKVLTNEMLEIANIRQLLSRLNADSFAVLSKYNRKFSDAQLENVSYIASFSRETMSAYSLGDIMRYEPSWGMPHVDTSWEIQVFFSVSKSANIVCNNILGNIWHPNDASDGDNVNMVGSVTPNFLRKFTQNNLIEADLTKQIEIKDGMIHFGWLEIGDYAFKFSIELETETYDELPVVSFCKLLNVGFGANYERKTGYYWAVGDKKYDGVGSLGVKISEEITDSMVGDGFGWVASERMPFQDHLVPPKYRNTLGAERFYNALNSPYSEEYASEHQGAYKDPDTNKPYVFPNPFVDGAPSEHIYENEDIKPTIEGVRNAVIDAETGLGQLFGEIADIAYDADDNDLLKSDATEENDKNDTLKYEHSFFYIKLNIFNGDYGFDLFDHASQTDAMTIQMRDGSCNGCKFKIQAVKFTDETGLEIYKNPIVVKNGVATGVVSGDGIKESDLDATQQNTQTHSIWICVQKDASTFGVIMPNKANNFKPQIGDKFNIINIDLPQVYNLAAEKRLEEEGMRFMADNNEEKFTFDIQASRIFFAKHPEVLAQLDEYSKIKVKYNGKVYEQYVNQFSIECKNGEVLPNIGINLTDTLAVGESFTEQVAERASSLIANPYTLGGVAPANGGNGLSTTLADKRYLNKQKDDRTPNKLSTDVGFEVGEFVSGSSGGIFFRDPVTGQTYIEVDKIKARMKAIYAELEVAKEQSIGGSFDITPGSGINISFVEELTDSYRCYFKAKEENKGADCRFVVGDQVRCRESNIANGTSQNASNRYYWRLVTAVNNDKSYIELSKTDCDNANGVKSDAPQVGDTIVQLGNRNNPERQSAIVLSTVDAFAPSVTLYDGIDSYSLDDKAVVEYGVDKTKNPPEPFFHCYGSFFFGPRPQENEDGELVYNSYLKFEPSVGKLIFSGELINISSLNGKNIDEYIKGVVPLDGYEYLKKALADGTTTTNGGLLLTSLIKLGEWDKTDLENPVMSKVWAGHNGLYKNDKTIASFWGGDMIDKYYDANGNALTTPLTNNYAKALVRMDGSAYFSDGNIGFEADGSGWLGHKTKGISFSPDGTLTLASGIKIEGGNETLQTLVNFVVNLSNIFIPENSNNQAVGWNSNAIDRIHIKKNFYSDGFVNAGAYDDDAVSGGGSGTLGGLLDVVDAASDAVSAESILVKESGATHWTLKALSSVVGLDETALQQYLTANGYLTSVSWGDVSGKPTWIGATKPSYDFSEIGSKPTTLAGYGITDVYTKSEADGRFALASTLSGHIGNSTIHITATERLLWNTTATNLAAILGSDSDTIINKWEEVIAFLDTYTEADTLANLLSNKADKATQIIAGTGLAGGGTLASDRTLSLATSGVVAGTYTKLTVDAYGRATAGSNPTTLAGYGITDAKIAGGVITLGGNTITPLVGADLHTLTIKKNGVQVGTYKPDADKTIDITDVASAATLSGHVSAYNTFVGNYNTWKGTVDTKLNAHAAGIADNAQAITGALARILANENKLSVLNSMFELRAATDGSQYIFAKFGFVGSSYVNAGDFDDDATSGGVGLDEAQLAQYLNTHGYATQQWVTDKGYLTSSALDNYATQSWVGAQGFLKSITKSQVEAVLTGNITSHTHSQYALATSLANYVTLNTEQTITKAKIFNTGQYFDITATSGKANGLYAKIGDNKDIVGGIGFLGNANNYTGAFIGWGASPWSFAKSLFVSDTQFTYKNKDVLHDGNTYISNGVITINGASITPVTSLADYYTKSEINTKLTDGSVTKVGTVTVGSSLKPIYLNAGVPTACSYAFGNGSGNVPVSNGTLCTNLNADMLDGLHANAFLQSGDNFVYAGGINTSATHSAFKIITTWPKSNGNGMPLINIRGYAYGVSATIDIDIVTYTYNNVYTSNSWTNKGSWCPDGIYLVEENGKLAIYILGSMYSMQFQVFVYRGQCISRLYTTGWAVEALADTPDVSGMQKLTLKSIDSNVASATKLQTSRNLWGQPFDGSANVSGNMTGVGSITATGDFQTTKTAAAIKANNGSSVIGLYNSTYRGVYDFTTNKWLIALSADGTKAYSQFSYFGLGTTVPAYLLDVLGTARVTTLKIGGVTLTDAGGYLHVDKGIVSDSFIDAGEVNDSAVGGGGLAYGVLSDWSQYNASAGEVLSASLGYDLYLNKAKQSDLAAAVNRIAALEGGSALSVTTSGGGNAVTAIAKSGTNITVTKGATFLTSHQSLANYVTLNTAQTISAAKIFNIAQYYDISANGGKANGMFAKIGNNTDIVGGIGFLGSSNNYSGAYIGWGNSPWSGLTSLFVSDTQFTYKNKDVLHGGNTYISNGVITINGASITPVTSLADYYTKTEADGLYLGKSAQAADSAKLGGVALDKFVYGTHSTATTDLDTALADTIRKSGFYRANSDNKPLIIHASHSMSSYAFQLGTTYGINTALFVRHLVNNEWGTWAEILDSKNYSNTLDGRYYTKSEINTKLIDGSVTKVGAANVGSDRKPIYLNAGVPTECITSFGNNSGQIAWSNGTLCTNLNADMLDGLHATSFYATKQLFSKADFQHYVVLLWKVNVQATHRINGKLYTSNFGASRYQAANIDLWYSRWSAGFDKNFMLNTFGLYTPWKLVTCTYNGEEWYALQHTAPHATAAYFVGTSDNIAFTAVHYYTSNTTTVVNSEINNSIADKTSELSKPSIGSNAYALVSDNVYSATKLQTSRNLWGQPFDGSANVSGNMTGVGSITATGDFQTTKTAAAIKANNGSSVIGLYNSTYRGVYDFTTNKWLIALSADGTKAYSQFSYFGLGTVSPAYLADINGDAIVRNGLTVINSLKLKKTWTELDTETELTMTPLESGSVRFEGAGIRFADTVLFEASSRPSANNAYNLGGASYRWASIYGVNGSFSGTLGVSGATTLTGLLNANGGMKTTQIQMGDGKIIYNSTKNCFEFTGGIVSNSFIDAGDYSDSTANGGGVTRVSLGVMPGDSTVNIDSQTSDLVLSFQDDGSTITLNETEDGVRDVVRIYIYNKDAGTNYVKFGTQTFTLTKEYEVLYLVNFNNVFSWRDNRVLFK